MVARGDLVHSSNEYGTLTDENVVSTLCGVSNEVTF